MPKKSGKAAVDDDKNDVYTSGCCRVGSWHLPSWFVGGGCVACESVLKLARGCVHEIVL